MRALRNAAKIGSVRPVVTLRKEQTLILLDPFHRRGRVYTRKFCLRVYLSVIFFLLWIFSSFSFSVFLLLCWPNIFIFFLLRFSSTLRAKYFPSQNIFPYFLLPFSLSSTGQIFAFSKYLAPFPSSWQGVEFEHVCLYLYITMSYLKMTTFCSTHFQ